MTPTTIADPLLTAAARWDSARPAAVAAALRAGVDWATLPERAEAHALAPLCWRALTEPSAIYGAAMDPAARRALQALTLRHRHANALRVRTLAAIWLAWQERGIPAVVLKGAALAHTVYPDPALRPMRDLDLLVRPQDARRAQAALASLGFDAPLPLSAGLPGKHLPAATCRVDGMSVSVEVHLNVFGDGKGLTLDDLPATDPCPLGPDGPVVRMLPPEEMLWHLCRHLRENVTVFRPARLIWVADVVGYAAWAAPRLDWERLARRYPLVPRLLALLHHLTPLPGALLEALPTAPGSPPAQVGAEFAGWPRTPLSSQRRKGLRVALRDTFAPPEWWLRLHHGLGPADALWPQQLLLHPAEILSWGAHWLRGRVFSPSVED